MIDLSVNPKNRVTFSPRDHTLIVSSHESVSMYCSVCGGMKSVVTFVGDGKYAVLQGTYTCTCRNARNPGGDNISRGQLDERRLLLDLFDAPTIEAMRKLIPIVNATHSVDLKNVLARLSVCQDITKARDIIMRHASAVEAAERGGV